jgi:hypothetical protein
MPVETRHMRADTHTVNGLTAYVFGLTQTGTEKYVEAYASGRVTCYYYWTLYIRHLDGTTTQIATGSFSRAADGSGYQSASVSIPETPMAKTDAIQLEVYCKAGTVASTKQYAITEQLGAGKLTAATWTVYLYTERTYDTVGNTTYADIGWGIATEDTRVEGISWLPPAAAPRLNPAIPAMSRAYRKV